ncbi:MAG: hypothetical protein DWQ05_01935 [Calditrichaeota bacterium]|nr:MAG: hypothetical protein DWQ05_01935 [Calditrichota bacterium]
MIAVAGGITIWGKVKLFIWALFGIILLVCLISYSIAAHDLEMGIFQYIAASLLSFLEKRILGVKYLGISCSVLAVIANVFHFLIG